ncbi:AAA family ATPase [Ponticoccus sp. SC2-23]|uniref:ATP-dependent DNA helicase n=1 Tax=Alexandriicola marinus TaxID=2081710 RepID=UPI000FDC463C|nr:AAA family ATPase [Alexandriicola marinus]MBM1220163.1 AAA family ATPase [Ponticoccus sp. SC6-9]MBM1224849.1 AAA family ATPase [Ponticoccus sp. SC6-15]MBM1228363.1 AAA family ATPase [Ponticoccus sp. SC6-38]MBM1234000.1 AAA family ATPase [Ponticoccus sp. SC6-45]MBM1238864.1 AAA family ATPase [Ponticoccus sp. SC6-49]MBM1242646.1 AAA family ATPase [Ponticoccus sp. SC2-64]MBM1247524.1 AAA family ATPase [Ponticoccus sp. SC6-42]MBM1251817.1 AAA family ATPase [Ponticoccus sp. SC6-33]MBM1256873
MNIALSPTLSDDQAEAWDMATSALREAGIDLDDSLLSSPRTGKQSTMAIIGKAGSGKTMLLASLTKALSEAGVDIVSGDWEGRRKKDRRTLAVLAPTNKAASVLRGHGVPATTIHRILYTPVYDPEYEKIAEWLAGQGDRPEIEGLTDTALDRAWASYQINTSVPAALAAAGLRGSDFITGWKRREEPLDVGFIDESSMLDARQFEDLQEIFPTLILFGDPAQLPPVQSEGGMVFETLPDSRKIELHRVHRQAADNPILDLAHALADPALDFAGFEDMVRDIATRDERVQVAQRVEADLMARSPVLVWRNATRIRLIHAFRAAYDAPSDELLPGEPLICDGIELPLKHRKKRLDLEARGLIKGAQAIYLGPGRKPGFSRLHVFGAEDPQISAASIVKIEQEADEEPFIPFAARMGATFLHGAAVTIHKAQGSQWGVVQVFAPDIYAAARMGRVEAGQPLWKRLTYVAITRAERELRWVVRSMLAKPKEPLTIDDLSAPAAPLTLSAEEG